MGRGDLQMSAPVSEHDQALRALASKIRHYLIRWGNENPWDDDLLRAFLKMVEVLL
jgi:hypothetical protein